MEEQVATKKLVYVYCVTNKTQAEVSFPSDERVGFGAPRLITFEDIAAVASDVPGREFSQDSINRKLSDPRWLADSAQRHELAIEHLMNYDSSSSGSTPVPMKLCTIFKNDARVVEMLSENYAKFKLALKKVDGRVEVGVTAFADYAKESAMKILSGNARIDRLQRRIFSSTPGRSYFLKGELDLAVSQEFGRRIGESAGKVMSELSKVADSAVANQPLASPNAENSDGSAGSVKMVLNYAFLVRKSRFNSFSSTFERTQKRVAKQGIMLKLSGPWPPYNFV